MDLTRSHLPSSPWAARDAGTDLAHRPGQWHHLCRHRDADPEKVSDYFLQLGTRVCDGLNRAGYPYCRGKVMANNPRWCRSLPDWISGFDEWVQKSEPQEIIDLSIFFDFRTVYGDAELTHELRRNIHTALTG